MPCAHHRGDSGLLYTVKSDKKLQEHNPSTTKRILWQVARGPESGCRSKIHRQQSAIYGELLGDPSFMYGTFYDGHPVCVYVLVVYCYLILPLLFSVSWDSEMFRVVWQMAPYILDWHAKGNGDSLC